MTSAILYRNCCKCLPTITVSPAVNASKAYVMSVTVIPNVANTTLSGIYRHQPRNLEPINTKLLEGRNPYTFIAPNKSKVNQCRAFN